ncbi:MULTISPECIES: tail tape measure protein [unclassified Pseudomonas]|uniref:tail tape measure protein n=1 Tax=unclassified Pseudomonas TaxID=196821 RepID=UPI0015A230E0|nr:MULTISPECIES: tail tape measure protein [unclassified Pseudomonas]NWC92390.1 tail tape measure protein [Pseudomonas sp. IPO3779]NWD19828.1 tail tape measure protein [Pseudomonas sp. IPO3778]
MQINYALAFAGQTYDRGLSADLSPAAQDLTGPSSLDAVPAGQTDLVLALASASLEINGLALEQVRLRETLETLNSTLFINGDSLATKTADAASNAPKSEQKEPALTTNSWVDKGLKAGADLGKDLGSSLWDTIKTRVMGNVVDVTLGKIPGVGKLFKDGGLDKGKDKGGDKQCCPGTAGLLETATAQLPESIGETLRKKDKARPPGNMKNRRVKLPKPGQTVPRGPAASVDGKLADLKQQRLPPSATATPQLNAMGQPLAPFSAKQAAQASTHLPGSSFASYAAPPASRPMARGAGKGLAASLSGAFAKLESAGTRRLGPLKYVDTAMDVVQGVRNGDAKAVASGLSTAGGAWAGASAGAAVGTLIFPGVGTAVGGVIGGLLGSEAGTWLGDKLFGPSDRLPAPNALSKELNSASADNLQITLAPSIQISGVNLADAQPIIDGVIQALQYQAIPTLTDALSTRRNAALTDLGGYA